MTSLFWRIFLTAWVIVLIMTALTLWAASALLETDDGPYGERVPEKIVAHVAHDLRRQLAPAPWTPAELLSGEYALDFAPLLEIYVLGPEGNDVLDRALPEAVVAARGHWRGEAREPGMLSPRVHTREVGGYLVVGYESLLPLARQWLRLRGVVFLIISAVASFVLARFIARPVRLLQLAGQKVAAGDLSVRVAHTVGGRSDEIAKLAHNFDAMTERVEALLRSQQRLMRDVSHELRSPLARLQALLSIARQSEGAVSALHIDRMEAQMERLDDLIGEILAYTRLESQDSPVRHPTDIVDLVQNIVDDASLEGHMDGKEVRFTGPASGVIDVDSGLIQSAVENVVRNALRYNAEGTVVEVSVTDRTDGVHIIVADQGPGVPKDAIAKLFEPFYRVEDGRSARSNSGGIGLAITERSIRLHGGTITARNRPTGGLQVEIVLP